MPSPPTSPPPPSPPAAPEKPEVVSFGPVVAAHHFALGPDVDPHVPGRRRRVARRVILALVLPGVAGAVNATSLLAFGLSASHVTGHVARIGDELAQAHWAFARQSAVLILAFYLGAVTAAALAELALKRERGRYVLALLVEAAALFVAATLGGSEAAVAADLPALLLGGAMGLQNALVTRISQAVVRTTHMTGILTDLGIETVRALAWLRAHMNDHGLLHLGWLGRLGADPEWAKLRLHLAILLSFVHGAILGPWLHLAAGSVALLLPAAVLVALALFDQRLGIEVQPGHDGHAAA